jgi:hypothetical protein
MLSYVEARRRIYCPCYLEMLRRPEQWETVERIRTASKRQRVYVWDPDSYDVRKCGMSDIAEAVDYLPRPSAHAFLVALAVQKRLPVL